MQKYQNSIQNRAGDAIYNALITVTTLSGAPVVVFSDDGVTPLTQVRTDDKGMFAFYCANGRYNLTVTGDHIVTYTLSDVMIDDSVVSTIVVDTFDTIENIAAIKALIGVTDNTTVSTLGYWAAGDGGQGTYRFDLADTTSVDNGGTIIVATDGGRWKIYRGNDATGVLIMTLGDGADFPLSQYDIAIANSATANIYVTNTGADGTLILQVTKTATYSTGLTGY